MMMTGDWMPHARVMMSEVLTKCIDQLEMLAPCQPDMLMRCQHV